MCLQESHQVFRIGRQDAIVTCARANDHHRIDDIAGSGFSQEPANRSGNGFREGLQHARGTQTIDHWIAAPPGLGEDRRRYRDHGVAANGLLPGRAKDLGPPLSRDQRTRIERQSSGH